MYGQYQPMMQNYQNQQMMIQQPGGYQMPMMNNMVMGNMMN